MKNNKYKIVYDESKISLAITVGIFYAEDYSQHDSYSHYQKIHLFTLCYRPKYKDFVQISDISNLPRRLRDRYRNAYNDAQTIKELENIGIHDFKKVQQAIETYHDYQDFLVYEMYKNKLQKNNDEIYKKLLEVEEVVQQKKLFKNR